jgi:hypothetical protein
MKTKIHLHLACLALSILPATLHAQAIKYMGGSGTILEGTKSADGEYAIVLTDAGDNVVVNLRSKNEVLKLTAEDDWQFPYFPGLNHGGLEVAWGPDQEGSRFGILLYAAKWETAKAFLIEVDPEFGSQTSIMDILGDGGVYGATISGVAEPENLAFNYSVKSVDAPEGDMVITDTLDVTMEYYGEIPKSEEETGSQGTFTITLERTPEGPVAYMAGEEVCESGFVPALDADGYRELRDRIDEEVEGEDIMISKAHAPGVDGRKLSYMGYLQAYVMKHLVYVDSQDDENETIILYYWQDGLLVSVYELKQGTDTEVSEVAKTVDIYNFENQQLVGWIRDGVEVDPTEQGFFDIGERILEESIERAGVIYAKVGAD